MKWRTAVLLAATACSVLAIVGCGDGGDGGSAEASTWQEFYGDRYGTSSKDVVVEMRDDGYHPRTVEVDAGGRVTWINTGTRRATAENFGFDGFHFDTHTIYRGQAKSITFDVPGSYDYFASYDAETFDGTVIVRPPSGSDR